MQLVQKLIFLSISKYIECYFLLLLFYLCLSDKTYSQNISYSKNYQIACHNCFEPQYADSIEHVFEYTPVIEFDIWDNDEYSGDLGNKLDSNWYVKHEAWTTGNLNCCGGTFRDCLNRVKIWGDKNSNHSVVTIFIDKKENWSEANEYRKPNDLDKLLVSIFSKEKIFTPSDLLGNNPNLKEAAATNKWVVLDSLKGKYIFVITDATIQLNIPWVAPIRFPLNEYLNVQQNNAVCFVAPQISREQEISQPNGFSQRNARNTVFYNLKCNASGLAEKINEINCLSRIFDCSETIENFNMLVSKKINFIAMKNYKLSQ